MATRVVGQEIGKVVSIKMARVGGLTASREVQALCAQHGIPCWVGGMPESAIGDAICVELATLPNFTYPADIFPSSYFYRDDIGKPEIALSGPGSPLPLWNEAPRVR